MSTYLYELGAWCYAHGKRVLVLWLVALAVFGGIALAVAKPYDDNFSIPGAASQDALVKLRATFPEAAATTATAVVVLPEGMTTDDPEARAAIERVVQRYDEAPGIDTVMSPFNEMVTGLVSTDKRSAILQLQLEGDINTVTDADREGWQQLTVQLRSELPEGSKLSLGGEIFSIEVPHLSWIEAIGVLIALVVLVVTLGSLVAAGLPLLTALLGVGFGMVVITAATALTSVNSTTPMLAVMLGLAVGIDYALFILSRHRDQLAHGVPTQESAARAVATAGSAVVFAGLTVIIALVGLAIGGIPFLTTMGLYAAVAVAFAVAIALTLLPGLMGLVGDRMIPKGRAAATATAGPQGGGIFGWWVRTTTRYPVATIIAVVVGLGALSIPAKDLWLSLPNPGQHPVSQPDRQTYDLVSEHFGPGHNGPLIVTVDLLPTTDPLGVMQAIKADVEKLPGVDSVPIATPNRNADTGFVQVVPTTGPDDPATTDLVKLLREQEDHWRSSQGVETAVTGSTAIQIDISDRLWKALLPFGLFVVGLSVVLLTMVFRSIWVPIKATVGYALSVGGAFGATQLVFNEGWFGWLVNADQPGAIISFLPIIVMGILFGLAMDYEVFLVTRIREEHIHGRSAMDAIRTGFIASGKVVTAAAVIMFSVFAFFVPEGMGPIKTIGFALALGVLLDAFLVRMTFVPAVLALLGERAWWLPAWLDRILPSFDVEGEALTHQLSLADWPSAGDSSVLHVEGLTAGDLFAPVDARLLPGQVGLVTGAPELRSAVLLALAGRLRADGGRGRVAGHLLPEQAGKARRAVRWVDASMPGALDRLERTDERTRLVVLDHVDSLPLADDRARVHDFIERARQQDHYGVVLGASDEGEWPVDGVIVARPVASDADPSHPALPDENDIPTHPSARRIDRELVQEGTPS
ncbi:MMPL family transporter [Aestuariimicrobium ganziense]|uniref:MMPL family transporter n=1 Tax=Aestuariimicrobium ganziense TaxID=2773677 RepID=UPI001941AFEA|nr:MMPL family transporter [Aestuariimicrobium ganziense]